MTSEKQTMPQTQDELTVSDNGYANKLVNDDQLEKFPSLVPTRKLSTKTKSKSLTEAEISMEIMGSQDLATVVERLKGEDSPLSLEQVRERKASIKEQRKESINLIRSRTASRASTSGRPSIDTKEDGSRIA